MEYPPIVAKKLESLLPESLRQDMTAFAFIPQLQNCGTNPEIVITTKRGEVVESKNRNITNSILINDKNVEIIKNVILHKRKNCKYLTYILQGNDVVYIITKEKIDEMMFCKKYNDVNNIVIEDSAVDGNAKVKLWLMDDAIPVVLNDDYSIEIATIRDEAEPGDDPQGLCMLLREKLAQAKFNTAYNKKIYEEKKMLRHELMNLMENVERFDRDGTKEEDMSATDKLTTERSWLRVHNKKIIVGVPVINLHNGSIDEIQLILRCDFTEIFSYFTKIYTEVDGKRSPYWAPVTKKNINSLERLTCVAIFDVPDFDEFAKITINMALKYKYNDKSLCLPLTDVEIKAFDIVNSEYDPVLNLSKDFDSDDMLSIISTSVSEELKIYTADNVTMNLDQFFIEKLKFNKCLGEFYSDILVHGQSPMNMLHGMTLYHNDEDINSQMVYNLHVFARSENQIMMLVNLIYDQIQVRCAIVPKNYTASIKDDAKSMKHTDENMETSQDEEFENTNGNKLMELASSLSQQMAAVVTHLEKCMEVMSEANTRNIASKNTDSSISIDVNALGKDKYEELWNYLIENMSLSKDLLEEIK